MAKPHISQFYDALQYSFTRENGLANYREAETIVKEWLKFNAPDQHDEIVWANLSHCLVLILSGRLNQAERIWLKAEQLIEDQLEQRLMLMTLRQFLSYERYNTRLDGAGASAMEIEARWDTDLEQRELMPALAKLRSESRNVIIVNFAWFIGEVIGSAKSLRSAADSWQANIKSEKEDERFVQMANSFAEFAQIAERFESPQQSVYALWCQADVLRRAGRHQLSEEALNGAFEWAKKSSDPAHLSFIQMTKGDWLMAPFGHVMSWDFSLAASYNQDSSLDPLIEARERQALAQEVVEEAVNYYQKAEEGFRSMPSDRGLAMLNMRYAYIATRQDNWQQAQTYLEKAEQIFRQVADFRGVMLAHMHQVMVKISTRQWRGLKEQVILIGRWGKYTGDFSFIHSLGMLLNRFARHQFLRQGRFEVAQQTYRLALQLFTSLEAPFSANQNRVDLAALLETTEDIEGALLGYESAAAHYLQLIKEPPTQWPLADRLSLPVLRQAIMLSSGSYNLCFTLQAVEQMEGFSKQLETLKQYLPAPFLNIVSYQKRLSNPTLQHDPELLHDFQVHQLNGFVTNILGESRFQIPYQEYQKARAHFDDDWLEDSWQRAFDQLAELHEERRYFYEAVLWGQKQEFERAIEAYQQHIEFKERLLGPIPEQINTGGNAISEDDLTVRKHQHFWEQSMSILIQINAFQEATVFWERLKHVFGTEWWEREPSPWRLGYDIAKLCQENGDYELALAYCLHAIEIFEKRRDQLVRTEQKTSIKDGAADGLYFLAAVLYLELGQEEEAFLASERGKARSLLDLMAAHPEQLAESNQEQELIQFWRERNARLIALRAQLTHQRELGASQESLSILEKQIEREAVQLEKFEEKLLEEEPDFFALVNNKAEFFSSEKIQEELDEDQLLVQYYLKKETFCYWAIDKSGIQVAGIQYIDAREFKKLMHQYIDACQNKKPVRDMARRLSNWFIKPIARVLARFPKVYFVPSGSLHLLPIHLLPLHGTALGKNHMVSYLPCASILKYLKPVALAKSAKALVIGNPTGDLKAAELEAAYIASLLGVEPYLRDEATEEAVREGMKQADILHLATHGNLSERIPLASNLALANGEALSLFEILGLKLSADLVVLSACETGKGRTTSGGEVVGFTRGWLATGIRSAIASYWSVDDLSTSLLMKYFYENIKAGIHPAEALHQAQNKLQLLSKEEIDRELETLDQDLNQQQHQLFGKLRGIALEEVSFIPTKDYTHPFYWAPFFYVGRF